ncbi:hypothetical protein QBC46DRAFT_453664 [Diplogelasinospora grovesii]|uniref:Uncharacterized protein n=1 Tax=Diplogelasinospora grovesii TaxID=303347 RepID=A0AAN6MYF2_9PEZI|nr:hypothetical protein QBC46DRAFT_453664 [Diplogelasinospora grovesii]
MRPNFALVFGSLVTVVAGYTCTEGTSWTPEEFAEYLTLNDTTGWAPMERIKHCYIDESDIQKTTEARSTELEARGGGNKYIAYSATGCNDNSVLFSVNDFGCGGCYSVGEIIESGYLWRQTTGKPYPTVDYYPGPQCQGSKLHHQGIYTGQYSSCDSVLGEGALSIVVYQGC